MYLVRTVRIVLEGMLLTMLSPGRLPLWLTIPLSSSSPHAEPSPGYVPVYANLQPLVGGPRFLCVHVCVLHNNTLLDFLPSRPSDFSVALHLLSGATVDGMVRCRPAQAERETWRLLGYSTRTSEEVIRFAREQPTLLSLRTNNCWTFARKIIDFAQIDALTAQ